MGSYSQCISDNASDYPKGFMWTDVDYGHEISVVSGQKSWPFYSNINVFWRKTLMRILVILHKMQTRIQRFRSSSHNNVISSNEIPAYIRNTYFSTTWKCNILIWPSFKTLNFYFPVLLWICISILCTRKVIE